MNTKFDFQRVILLLRRQFALEKRQLWINLLTMTGIATIIAGVSLTIAWYSGPHTTAEFQEIFHTIQIQIFPWFVCIGASVFAGKMFVEYGQKDQGIASLMLPATHFEKWLVAFLLSTVYFLVAVVATFLIAILINVIGFNLVRPIKIDWLNSFDVLKLSNFWPVLQGFLCVHSLFFLGSIFFDGKQNSGNQWWKTTLALMSVGAVYGILQAVFPYLLWPTGTSIKSSAGIDYVSILNDGIYSIPKSSFWNYSESIMYYFIPPVCWFLSYLKLTEKQI